MTPPPSCSSSFPPCRDFQEPLFLSPGAFSSLVRTLPSIPLPLNRTPLSSPPLPIVGVLHGRSRSTSGSPQRRDLAHRHFARVSSANDGVIFCCFSPPLSAIALSSVSILFVFLLLFAAPSHLTPQWTLVRYCHSLLSAKITRLRRYSRSLSHHHTHNRSIMIVTGWRPRTYVTPREYTRAYPRRLARGEAQSARRDQLEPVGRKMCSYLRATARYAIRFLREYLERF